MLPATMRALLQHGDEKSPTTDSGPRIAMSCLSSKAFCAVGFERRPLVSRQTEGQQAQAIFSPLNCTGWRRV